MAACGAWLALALRSPLRRPWPLARTVWNEHRHYARWGVPAGVCGWVPGNIFYLLLDGDDQRHEPHRIEDALFAERVPTAENIARAVYHEIEAPIAAAGPARLCRVRVLETRKNTFVYGDSL